MMNSNKIKRFKQSNDCKKSSLERNEQEVLVLPPNLLQQLGINLQNIRNTPDCPIIKDVSNSMIGASGLQNENISAINGQHSDSVLQKETSIKETPSLLKKAVPHSPSNLNTQSESIKKKNIENDYIFTINVAKTSAMKLNEVEIQVNQKDEINNDFSVHDNVLKTNIDFAMCHVDNNDELLKSVHSNKKPSKCNSNTKTECKNKINIISHEIIGVETFNKLFPTPKPALIPFTIDTPIIKLQKSTLIYGSKHTSTGDIENSTLNCFKDLEFDKNKKPEIGKDIFLSATSTKDNNFITTDTNNLQNNTVITAEILTKKCNKGLETFRTTFKQSDSENIDSIDTNESINNPDQLSDIPFLPISGNSNIKTDLHKSNNMVTCREKNNNFSKIERGGEREVSIVPTHDTECTEIAEDKIKEIANYLSLCLSSPEKANISSKRFVTKSKLCIQGVEKPGGVIKKDEQPISKPFRTYENRKTKNIKTKFYNINHNEVENNKYGENNYIIDNVNDSSLDCIVEQLCVCNDFGRLQFDDYDSEYQHIHFWEKNTVQCSPTSIFEIYNDNHSDILNKEINDCTYENYENSDSQQFDKMKNICCMEYESLEHDKFLETCLNNVLNVSQNQMQNTKKCHSKILRSSIKYKKTDISMNSNNIIIKDDKKFGKSASSTSLLRMKVDMNDCTMLYKEMAAEKKSRTSSFSKDIVTFNEIKTNNTKCSNIEEVQEHSKINNSNIKKRRRALKGSQQNITENNAVVKQSPNNISTIKCGVCAKELSEVEWKTHISNEHSYIAWQEGHNIDLGNKRLLEKITKRLRKDGALECTFCGKEKKFLNNYMIHIRICMKKFCNVKSDINIKRDIQSIETEDVIECGVCAKQVITSLWMDHIATEHNYKAWKHKEPALDLNDQEQIRQHLYNITKQIGELVCAKCGLRRKYVKAFMEHVKICDDGTTLNHDSEIGNQLNNTHVPEVVNGDIDDNSLIYTGVVKCGVCQKDVDGEQWVGHIEKDHNYMARIDGKTPLDLNDADAVKKHLHRIRSITGYLICGKCGLKRKFIKTYLEHIKSCDGSKPINESQLTHHQSIFDNTLESSCLDKSAFHDTGFVKCGVCAKEMGDEQWVDHIHKEHDYVAWIEGKPPLDVNNEEQVWQYLNTLTKQIGGLTCAKCGMNRKYVKAYLQHIKICDGYMETSSNEQSNCDLSATNLEESVLNYTGTIKCGVCEKEMDGEQWVDHIYKEHDYIAWVAGKPPLNLYNEESVRQHLQRLSKQIGGLLCGKCGLNRKFVKQYLYHVKNCDGRMEKDTGSLVLDDGTYEEENEFIHTGTVKCGVCKQEVDGDQWIEHIYKEHDYFARIDGKPPLDINDEDEVRRHLTSLRKCVEELVCPKCGQARKFVKVYMKHIRNCDGSELQEIESLTDLSQERDDTNNLDISTYCLLKDSNVIYTEKVKCGVCQKEMEGGHWLKHIQTEHDYIARVEGKSQLDVNDKEQVRLHLYSITKQIGGLVCSKCGVSRKYVKAFLQHVESCDGKTLAADDSRQSVCEEPIEEEIQLEFEKSVICGVCKSEVEGDEWIQHIQKEHNYLAHVEGKPPLDLNNKKLVQKHLYAISKRNGGLFCAKCGIMRMYIKSYLRHVRNCNNSGASSADPDFLDPLNDSVTLDNADDVLDRSVDMSEFVHTGIAKCGVCQEEVEGEQWINHIQKEHNYLARIEGKPPLDLHKSEEVQMYLYCLSKMQNGLICKTCGVKRKYVKSFLDHIESCKNRSYGDLNEDNLLECAICSEKVLPQNWKSHAMKNHYNIAWATGMEPIDIKNPYTVEKYLKDYKQVYKHLICKICKTTRVSCAGFYAHIITCGKTEEEIEFYKSHCDICNCKYLCIYKNQHLGMHREQEFAKEKKLRILEEKRTKMKEDEESTQGRRRAAERAKTVIENYKTIMGKFKHKCSSCGFGTDLERELDEHTCETCSDRLSDSDVSMQYDAQSEETDSDVDSNVSLEEAEVRADKKKRYIDLSAKIPRLLFKVNSASNYVSNGALDFFNMHYTLDVLFPNWKTSDYQKVRSEDITKYLPPLEESCKVKVANGEWTTYKRFEAKKDKVSSVFVGACIRCVAWVPVRAGAMGDAGGNYLAVASHAATDAPRLPVAQLASHQALLQLWHFADFASVPTFVMGIAHDYGTIWAMDWCPSGVRDYPCNTEYNASSEARLGLLATACSNGSAYIFVVPYPTESHEQNSQIIKIKPSVELRLCSSGERKTYQATAICWSQQKGHTIILVGYADGTTAFYNLDCDSPFLKTMEDGVTILYPFQDERPHNTCVSDVGLFPSDDVGGGGAWGAWSGASCTGVHASLCAPALRLHSPLATARASFTPHWPSVIITADEAIANHTTNELEWQGSGRRLGGQRTLATCARCGLGAAYTPPALRVTRTHPAYRDPRRDVVGFIRMAPLAKKRSKHTNDELSMKVEPLTYEDAVKEYGIEFKLKSHMDKVDNQLVFGESKQHFPERFPLADVPSMSFCTSPVRHGKLAVATHAGLIFIVNI